MKKILMLFSLLCVAAVCFAQGPFENIYGNTQNNGFNKVIYSTLNQAFFAVGSQDNLPTLTKLDNAGNIVWTRNYDANRTLYDMVEAPNGDLVMLGIADGVQGVNTSAFLVRVTGAAGAVVWERIYDEMPIAGGSVIKIVKNLIVSANNPAQPNGDSYIFSGYFSNGANDLPMLVRVNGVGAIIWSNTYSNGDTELGNIVEDGAGGATFVCNSTAFALNNVFIRVDVNGLVIVPTKQLNINVANFQNRTISRTPTGEYLISFYQNHINTNAAQLFVKLDAVGNVIWSRLYTPPAILPNVVAHSVHFTDAANNHHFWGHSMINGIQKSEVIVLNAAGNLVMGKYFDNYFPTSYHAGINRFMIHKNAVFPGAVVGLGATDAGLAVLDPLLNSNCLDSIFQPNVAAFQVVSANVILQNAAIMLNTANSNSIGNLAYLKTALCINPVLCNIQSDYTFTTNCSSVNFSPTVTGCSGTLAYSWDFGDGDTCTHSNPTHVYSNVGNYTACLYVTCTTQSGVICTDTTCYLITINGTGPTSNFCYTVNSNTKVVTFNGVTTNNCSGTKTYTWDFGDGTSSLLMNPGNHTYALDGTYTVCLTTKCISGQDTCCTKCCKTVIVPAPCPSFTANFTTLLPVSGYSVVFNAASGTSPTYTYLWEFYNSANVLLGTANVKTPTFNFSTTGTYKICLTVTYGNGNANGATCTKTQCKDITLLNNAACSANANFRYVNCTQTPLNVTFTNTSTGASTYTWDFGDGTTFIGTNPPAHVYPNGTTTPIVCLTAKSGVNCISTVCIRLNLSPISCTPINCFGPSCRLMLPIAPKESDEEANETIVENNIAEGISEPTHSGMKNVILFPNPTDNILQIQTENLVMQGARITVTTMLGILMYDKLSGSDDSKMEIDMSAFSSGVYIIAIEDAEGNLFTRKVVKQ